MVRTIRSRRATVPRFSSNNNNNAVNYNYRPRSYRRPYRRPRYNNNKYWVNRQKPIYDSQGNRIHRRINNSDGPRIQQRFLEDSRLSASRNNRTALASQQQHQVLGADGETYALTSSADPRKRRNNRGLSKRVAQNMTISETGMGNYSDAHAQAINRIRSASTDFADYLVRSAIWWLAQGWYVAMRKAYIAIGPASQNDKYFVNIPNPFATHRDVVYFLDRILHCCYNNIRAKGQQLDFKVPKHISFALGVLATKQLQRTPTGVIDMATQPEVLVTSQSIVDTYWNYLTFFNEVIALPAHPFATTCVVEIESPITVYHDVKGEAIHSTMKLEEIASVYGYFIPNGGIVTAPKDVFNYDYNGFDHPSSTQLFRSAFFRLVDSEFTPVLELNPQLMPNQFCDPRLVMLNFAATGFVPTSEHTMYCVVQHMSSAGDRVSNFTQNTGLAYISNKMVGAPTQPAVTANALAYNCALDLAMALQMQVSNFMQAHANTADPSHPFSEIWYSWAVSVAQYIEKIPLPSVIFEEMKNFSDVNSWTMHGKPEPTAMYYKYVSIYCENLSTGANPPGSMTLNSYYQNVAESAAYMMEVRNFVRLNMAPEINNFMPSLHLMVKDSQNRIYSILDAESFHHKDIAMWLNYSYIPEIAESRPLPLTYIEVKAVDADYQLSRIYQMSFDASYQGKSSELDAYYMRLRDKQIGFFGALSSILGAILPAVPSLVSAIFKPKNKQAPKAPAETTKSTFSTGALVQSLLSSLVNEKDFKQVAVNAPDTGRKTVRHPDTKKQVSASRPMATRMARRRLLRRLGRSV